MIYLELVAGLCLLVAGGDGLVRGAVALARRIGVSPLLIGLTLVGFGTSTPELLTSLQAAVAGLPGISVGNVVGSNTANILLILGATAIITPVAASRAALWRDGSMMIIAALACVAVVLAGWLDRLSGGVLVLLLVAYIVYTYVRERRSHDASAVLHEAEGTLADSRLRSPCLAGLVAVGGLALTMLGAKLLVDSASGIARDFGVSETIIGLTVVAVGTSLPELVASMTAALRRQTDLALGNIIGSNIYNVLGILGVTALVHPIPVPPEIARLDVWVMLAASVALVVGVGTGLRLNRMEGLLFLLGYAVYIGALAGLA